MNSLIVRTVGTTLVCWGFDALTERLLGPVVRSAGPYSVTLTPFQNATRSRTISASGLGSA